MNELVALFPTAALPTGTITFLFTDIEGSTTLWENHPEAMQTALTRHDALLRTRIESFGGVIFKTIGDAFCAAFADAPNALSAAVAAQNALIAHPWPDFPGLRVRMALHTGTAEARDADYFGPALNRVSRLLGAGHGGQILLSAASCELVRDRLPEGAVLQGLGQFRLKNLERPEHVFQVNVTGLPHTFAPLRTLDSTPNNLPQQVTSLVGREKAAAEVTALLAKTRLLTLTGSGGSGKTRLSLQAAADVLEGYPDGAWQVELAPLLDPILVAQAVAAMLGIKEQVGRSMTQTLISGLQNKHLLLVLDNCEHLLEACAQLTAVLLRACPRIKILATSRAPLGIAGETTYRVPSLSLPTAKQARTATIENVNQFEAVRLFIERAQAVKTDFIVTNTNAPALAQVCFRLDGIPLALELAAARVRSLAVEQINDRLDTRFRILTGGDRSALPRQQTLRALVDWSYDLLSDTEKTLFARLSVFAGGWTLQAAETVGGFDPIKEWEVMDVLTSLVDKSLVVVDEADGTSRYRLLETLRQYAGEKLDEQNNAAHEARTRHRDYFVALAEGAEKHQWSADQLLWLNRLETEHDNLRTALDTCCGLSIPSLSATEAGLRLGGALWNFWSVRGYHTEGRDYLAHAIQQARGDFFDPALTSALAKALYGAGILAREQGEYPAARKLHEESLVLCRERGDKAGMGNALNNLGLSALAQGDFPTAQALFEEGLLLRRDGGDKNSIAGSLGNLGIIAYYMGDLASARARYEECLTLRRETGNQQGIAQALENLGGVASSLHDYETARALYEESHALYTELENQQGIAQVLGFLAEISASLGDYKSAQALHAEELAIKRTLGDKPGLAVALTNLGSTCLKGGETDAATKNYAEALALFQEQGNKYGIVYALEGTATALVNPACVPDTHKAVVLWAATTALREQLGVPPQEARHSVWLEAARTVLGVPAYAAAWNEGRELPWEQAMHHALTPSPANH